MREIWFKAKRISDGEWVEGFYVMYSTSIAHPYSHTNGDHYIITVPHNYKYQVDPETVCQYTGLTDKNGKKIFEGDIIKDIDYGIMRCMYLHGSFVWYKEDGFHIKCMNYIPVIEVIGNIFDNKELLERRQYAKS